MLLDCHVLGVIKTAWLEQEMVDALHQKLMVDVDVASQFTRAVLGGVKYHFLAYTQVIKRNNYTACF